MIDRETVRILYLKTQSYAKTGYQLGVSRQRIHQIVKNYKNFGLSGREKIYKIAWKDTCQICFKNPTDHIHHKNKKNHNDSMENLISVCIPCHKDLHLSKIGKKRKVYVPEKKTWSRKHADKCGICNNKKYYARGLCRKCYMQVRIWRLRSDRAI